MTRDARLQQILQEELDRLDVAHLRRTRRALRTLDAVHVEHDGRALVNFASNDYLGLTHHPAVISTIQSASAARGAGSGAAGLITGYSDVHASAEAGIARWKGTESAVLLPSGYQANHAVIQTLAALGERGGGVRFLIDKLVHASLVDAVRSTALTAGRGRGATFRVFPHNSLSKLRRLLEEAPDGEMQVVVTESIFSMDGDAANLAGLAQLKAEHPFVFVLDEAHGAGVYGPGGSGVAAELGLQQSVDVSIATLSKAIGCVGGAVCGTQAFCDALINFGRAYVFSTSIPPFIAAGAETALAVMRDEPQRQSRVRDVSRRVRGELAQAGFELPAGDSPIIPIVLGSETRAKNAADRMLDAGLLVLPVRPPTVPKGTSRLRVTLSSEHTDPEIQQLIDVLRGLCESGEL